jgi:hypothetical protein
MDEKSNEALKVLRRAWVGYAAQEVRMPLVMLATTVLVSFSVWFVFARTGLEVLASLAVGSLLVSFVFRMLSLEFLAVVTFLPGALLVPLFLGIYTLCWGLGALIGKVRVPAIWTGRRIRSIEQDTGDHTLFRITLRTGEVFAITHWPLWEVDAQDYASSCVVGEKRIGRSGPLGYVLGDI